jgi:hypothetical protein
MDDRLPTLRAVGKAGPLGEACHEGCVKLRARICFSSPLKMGRDRAARPRPERGACEHKEIARREAHGLLVVTSS